MEENEIVNEQVNEDLPKDETKEENPIDVIEFAKQSVRDELNPIIEDLKKRNTQLEYLLKNTTNAQVETKKEEKINYVKWH